MKRIHTVIDLRAWADLIAAGASEFEMRTLLAGIVRDEHRPAWGEDWSKYLAGVDVAETFRSGRLVRWSD